MINYFLRLIKLKIKFFSFYESLFYKKALKLDYKIYQYLWNAD